MWVMAGQSLDGLDDSLDLALTYADGTPVYDLSNEERAAIHVVYELYETMLGQPHADLTPDVLDAARPSLREAYGQVQIGGRLAGLRARLLASAISCPYCGFGEPRDLDHYLPRNSYGELAIYPNNLIPSCSPCNNAKRAIVPGLAVGHGPGLIHAYFQTLPESDFLKADLAFTEGVLTVQFCVDQNEVEPVLAEKLQFQLERLKLNDRYARQINKFISEQRVAILMCRKAGVDALRSYFQQCERSLAQSFHRNDWRVALLRALAESDEFCNSPELYLGAELEEP